MRPRFAELQVLAATILWGTTGPVEVLAHLRVPPAALGAIRILTGGIVLLTWVIARYAIRRRGTWRSVFGFASLPVIWRPVAVAACATGVFQGAYFTAVSRAGAALATAIVFGVAPVATGLWAWAAERSPLTIRWSVGTTCAIAGCVLLLLPAQGGHGDTIGVALAVISGACYAVYTVAAKRFAEPGGEQRASAGVVLAVAITLVAGGLMLTPWLVAAGPGLLTGRTVLAVAWLGPVTTAVAYLLFVRGLHGVTAPTAGTLSLAEPLVAAILGLGLLHERLAGAAVTGCLLLAAGLIIAAVPLPRPRRTAPTAGT